MARIHYMYMDGECFKPGEIWLSPRGTFYTVEDVEVGGKAKLRIGNEFGKGRIVRRDWDAADDGWVIHQWHSHPSE